MAENDEYLLIYKLTIPFDKPMSGLEGRLLGHLNGRVAGKPAPFNALIQANEQAVYDVKESYTPSAGYELEKVYKAELNLPDFNKKLFDFLETEKSKEPTEQFEFEVQGLNGDITKIRFVMTYGLKSGILVKYLLSNTRLRITIPKEYAYQSIEEEKISPITETILRDVTVIGNPKINESLCG